MSHDLILRGIRPEPIGSYLQALGVLAVVGGQADGRARGWWSGDSFILRSQLSEVELAAFFLDRYSPTPVVSPWNKGAGFRRDGKSRSAEKLVEKVEASADARLVDYRDAIGIVRPISDDYDDATFAKSKEEIVLRARAALGDRAVDWVDASVVLTSRGPVYPHVLGTGGNFGRQDLSANFMAHLDSVIGLDVPADRDASEEWLRHALLGGSAQLVRASAGQYDPGRAGGANQSTLDDGPALVNPWAIVLQIEGSLLFASGVSRRLGGHADNVAAMPFTTRASEVGAGHLTPEENVKGELWLPLWDRPATASEVRRLFAEARLSWRDRSATRGIDAARAIASLGADRGIPVYTRSVISERLGQNPMAVPVGRISSGSGRLPALTASLDPWLRRLRSSSHRGIQRHLRVVDELTMTVAMGDGATGHLQDLLGAVAEIEKTIGRNGALRTEYSPLPPLRAQDWLPELDDGTPEFRLAWCLASLSDRPGSKSATTSHPRVWRPSLRSYLRDVVVAGGRLTFSPPLGLSDVRHRLIDVLSQIHAGRSTWLPADGDESSNYQFDRGTWCPWPIAEAFASGALDDLYAARLLRILVLLEPSPEVVPVASTADVAGVSPAFRLIAPMYARGHLPSTTESAEVEVTIEQVGPDPRWASALDNGRVLPVLRRADVWRRAIFAQAELASLPADVHVIARATSGPRLNAALLVNLGSRSSLLDHLYGNTNLKEVSV